MALENSCGDRSVGEPSFSLLDQVPKVMNTFEEVLKDAWNSPQRTFTDSGQDEMTRLGIKILSREADTVLRLAKFLPDGTYDVRSAIQLAENIPFFGSLDGKGVQFLKGFDSITKDGDHFKLTRNADANFEMDHKVPGSFGRVTADNLKVGRTVEFDLQQNGSEVKLANVRGISVDATGDFVVAKSKYHARVKEITLTKDGSGETIFNAKVENPSTLSKLAGKSGDVDVQVKVNGRGEPELVPNSKQSGRGGQFLVMESPY